jgi:hypothetical protein
MSFDQDPIKRAAYLATTRTRRLKGMTSYYSAHREKFMFSCAKKRAEKKGWIFNITIEDIKIPKVCPLLGLTLDCGARGKNSPSLDRKDSAKGYTKDNVWVISWRANDLKRDATLNEMSTLLKNWRKHARLDADPRK